MQLIPIKAKIENYLDIDITTDNGDYVENARVTIDVTFSVDTADNGILVDVYRVNGVSWEFEAVTSQDDEDDREKVFGESDASWKVEIKKSGVIDGGDNFGMFLSFVDINLKTKKIELEFTH